MNTPNTWAASPEHQGYREKIIRRGNCTITILRPVLEEEERQKRERHTRTVAETVLRDYYKRKDKTS